MKKTKTYFIVHNRIVTKHFEFKPKILPGLTAHSEKKIKTLVQLVGIYDELV